LHGPYNSHHGLFPHYLRFLDLKPTIIPICLKHIPQPSFCDIRFSRNQDQSVGDADNQKKFRLICLAFPHELEMKEEQI
jgi:hypothetical protein